MNKLLFGLVASAVLGIAAPASAQVFIGADSGGAGVQIGPVGAGVGPRFSNDGYYHRRGYDANAYYGGTVAAPAFSRIAQFSMNHLQIPPSAATTATVQPKVRKVPGAGARD
jgi:hypothetical protein